MKRRCTRVRDLRVISQNRIISELSQGVRIGSSLRAESNLALISEIQLECVEEALRHQSRIEPMKEELNQSEKSKV